MKWEDFLSLNKNIPVIESKTLLSIDKSISVQLSRWVKSGKLIEPKRGLYVVKEPYRRIEIYEPYLAFVLKKPSYISFEKSLEYHNLIPEGVPVFTSITTKRQSCFKSELGIFRYFHIKPSLFWGYFSVTVKKQTGFIAFPEKALLDLIYMRNIKVSMHFLEELRLQNLKKIKFKRLDEYAGRFNKPTVISAVKTIKEYIKIYRRNEKTL